MAAHDPAQAPGPQGARLELDYQQTLVTWRMPVDLRFRLLAFVPAITGVLVALAGRSPSAASVLVAVGPKNSRLRSRWPGCRTRAPAAG